MRDRASDPKVTMDANGNAVAVWDQNSVISGRSEVWANSLSP